MSLRQALVHARAALALHSSWRACSEVDSAVLCWAASLLDLSHEFSGDSGALSCYSCPVPLLANSMHGPDSAVLYCAAYLADTSYESMHKHVLQEAVITQGCEYLKPSHIYSIHVTHERVPHAALKDNTAGLLCAKRCASRAAHTWHRKRTAGLLVSTAFLISS